MKTKMSTSPCSTLNDEQKRSLLLVQKYLHHSFLRIPADSTTEERITAYNEQHPKLSPSLERQLREAAAIVVGWVWQNKAALYQMVYRVAAKNKQLLNNGFYHEDELFNNLFLESIRILYNYDFDNPAGAKPLTYLLGTLGRRKYDLVALDTPYSDDVGLYI